MKRLLLAGLFALTAFAGAGDDMKVWFVYLMRGDGPRPTDQKALEDMQKGHIDNLVDIGKNHGGLAAGPLDDPGQNRRGIVVVRGKSEEDVNALFDRDPYMKSKIMRPKAFSWSVDPAVFKNTTVDPKGMAEYRLVVFTPGKALRPINDSIMNEHREFLDSMKASHHLRVIGKVSGATKIREIAIFESKDEKGIAETLAKDPLVQNSLLEVEIIPLWMLKGIFGS